MQLSEKTTIHQVQAKILLELAKVTQANFAALNIENLSSDWFSFHVRQVIKNGWVIKTEGIYSLTNLGKKVVIQLNNQTNQFEPAQRISVLLVIELDGKFVVQERSIEPFKGFWEFPTKKIGFGQSPQEVITDILENELGLSGDFSFVGVVHKVETVGGDNTFDDKYYLVYTFKNISGTLQLGFFGGKNYWLTEAELLHKELSHFDVEATFLLLKKETGFEEVRGEAAGY